MSANQQQMGRLRKFAGVGLLSRFRSGSKTTSDDDDSPRSGAVNVAQSMSPCSPSQPDPLAGAAAAAAVGCAALGVSDVTNNSSRLSGDEQVMYDASCLSPTHLPC